MKILFVHQRLMSFVKKDMDILSSKHELREIQFPNHGNFRNLLKSILKIWKGVLWCDLTFSWFGKLNAFFAILFSKILGKKSVVVAGNDDVFKFVYNGQPYGILAHPIKKWFSYYAFQNADQILAVSNTSLEEAVNNAKADAGKTKMIYHGFDPDRFKKLPSVQKEKMVVTVGRVTDETFIQKGLKLFVESARYFTDTQFVLVGPFDDSSIERLKEIAPLNVTFTGWFDDERLIEILSKASVYVQASIHEAFGCSIAEAMLCECIPVVSLRTALPEVVGDCGFYVDRFDPEALAGKIKEALYAPRELGKRSQEWIAEKFPLERRRRELLAALELLL